MQLVLLAAGHGRRFGGLKQLAPVGPNGESLMDYTARSALAAGFEEAVLVVRDEVKGELLAHIEDHWPRSLKVTPVTQGPVAGTTQAVMSAGRHVRGPFGVVNADDLYGDGAILALAEELRRLDAEGEHVNLAYRLANTVFTDEPVTRGVCRTGDDGYLVEIAEQKVQRESNGYFIARPLHAGRDEPGTKLTGGEDVSMNLWGFSPSVFSHLERALEAFDPDTAPHEEGKPPEVLLPTVVGDAVRRGHAKVRVVPVEGRCVGITHPDDLDFVRTLLPEETAGGTTSA